MHLLIVVLGLVASCCAAGFRPHKQASEKKGDASDAEHNDLRIIGGSKVSAVCTFRIQC